LDIQERAGVQELVRKGRAVNEPWKFYDLGHGYCTYDFVDQCPPRMACAKCSFYLPKDSTEAQLLEAKANLSRLRQEIPLADAEISAVEDGLTAYEQLLAKLADVPTPAGPIPCLYLSRLRSHATAFLFTTPIKSISYIFRPVSAFEIYLFRKTPRGGSIQLTNLLFPFRNRESVSPRLVDAAHSAKIHLSPCNQENR
jgi:hypothetical protein